jgi:hypothetical protein
VVFQGRPSTIRSEHLFFSDRRPPRAPPGSCDSSNLRFSVLSTERKLLTVKVISSLGQGCGSGLDPDSIGSVDPGPYWIRIRIGIQPKMLDPDPREMNADPQPWSWGSGSVCFRPSKIRVRLRILPSPSRIVRKPLISVFLASLCFFLLRMMKIYRCSESESVCFRPRGSKYDSVSQRYGSEDPDSHPDPYQNVTDPQHWLLDRLIQCFGSASF